MLFCWTKNFLGCSKCLIEKISLRGPVWRKPSVWNTILCRCFWFASPYWTGCVYVCVSANSCVLGKLKLVMRQCFAFSRCLFSTARELAAEAALHEKLNRLWVNPKCSISSITSTGCLRAVLFTLNQFCRKNQTFRRWLYTASNFSTRSKQRPTFVLTSTTWLHRNSSTFTSVACMPTFEAGTTLATVWVLVLAERLSR